MSKLLIFVITLCLLVIGVIWGIQSYLSIDNLSGCDSKPDSSGECSAADAIVVISGGDTAARVKEAIELYDNGWAPLLVFSGAAEDTSGPSNAATMRKQALAAGVPDSDIIIEEESQDTEENAINTAKILDDADRIILVTSPYHQRRAYIEFKMAFGNNVEIVNHPTQSDRSWTAVWFMTPNGWWLAISELVKTVVISV